MSSSMPPSPPSQPPPPGGGYGPPPGGGYGPPPGGGYGPPPGGGYGPPPGGVAPPSYDAVAAVKYGWSAFTRNAAPFVILTAVLLGVSLVISLGTNLVTTGHLLGAQEYDATTELTEMLTAQLVSLVGSFVTTILGWIIGVAMMRGALDVVDTGTTDLAAMFTRINWGHAIGAALLVTLSVGAGLLLCIIPGFVVGFLLWFSTAAVVDGESATGALSASYRFTSGNVGNVLLFGLLALVLVVIGVCTLGLGLLVASPVITIGMAYTWRVLQGRPVAA